MSDDRSAEAVATHVVAEPSGHVERGQTVADAVEAAAAALGLTRGDIEYEVVDPGRPAEPGCTESRVATVRAWQLDGRAARGRSAVAGLLSLMGLAPTIAVRRQPAAPGEAHPAPAIIDVRGQDLGLLIGWRGETLQALQMVVNLMLGDHDGHTRRVIVDVEGYRARRELQAAELGLRVAQRVRESGQRQLLDPMRGYERRAIHMALEDDQHLRTESIGKEPVRRVVIHPAGAGADPSG